MDIKAQEEKILKTEDDWQDVWYRLRLYYTAVLNVDDHNVFLFFCFDENKLSATRIMILVKNVGIYGDYKGELEITKGLCRPVKKYVYTAKSRKSMKKLSKKRQKEYGCDPDKRRLIYSPFWTNFKAMVKHIMKNNKEIKFFPYSSAVIHDNKPLEKES